MTDADILREVVNTVGRPSKLGEHIRCVVSVGMLTEGWDANTVTHIVGVRAFGSQLLCEQVAGRALRRRQYFLDPKTGKFPPEYAHIIGVPFKFFKGGQSELLVPQNIKLLKALPERGELEIGFPNLVGYKIEQPHDEVRADFSGTPGFAIDFNRLPTRTAMGTAFSGEREQLRAEPDSLRDQEVVYWIAAQVLSHYFRDEQHRPQLAKFGDVRRIAQTWYDTKIELLGETDLGSVDWCASKTRSAWPPASSSASKRRGQRGAGRRSADRATAQPLQPKRLDQPCARCHQQAGVRHEKEPCQSRRRRHRQLGADRRQDLRADRRGAELRQECLSRGAVCRQEGAERRYLPDYLCRVQTPGGEHFNLIVEVTGFERDKAEKRYFVRRRWLPAVNKQREKLGMLPWHFIEVTDIERIKNQLLGEIGRISAIVDDEADSAFWAAAQNESLGKVWDNEYDAIWDTL